MYRTTPSMIVEPSLSSHAGKTDDSLEISVHTVPKSLYQEFRHVFGSKYLEDLTNSIPNSGSQELELLAIPTNQHAREDLVQVGDEVELEKDRLLNVFLEFGEVVCQKIRDMGYWADFIDPCSGLPMIARDCNKVYSEVDGMQILLKYKAQSAGFCKVLLHPRWGSAVYPATIFCYAPRDTIVELVKGLHIPSP